MKPRFYRPELDTLRFFAFFAVFLHHVIPNNAAYFSSHGVPARLSAVLAATASAGAFGVDLFFLLSAFLITELLLREREHTGQLNVRAFYIRRILRIWPLYFLLITIASLLPLIDAHESFDWRYKFGFLFLSGNWVCSAVGYPNSIAAPLWSVSIEEQFYLLWPNAVRRAGKNAIIVIAALLVVVAWVARAYVVTSHSSHPALWCNTLCRLDPIAFGIILALVLRTWQPRLHIVGRAIALISGVAVLIAAAGLGGISSSPLPVTPNLLAYPAATLGCLAIFIAWYSGTNEPAVPLSAHPRLTYLGKISYGLYAYHVLCIWLAARLLSGHSAPAALLRSWLALALTIALAALSYRFFEAPFLELKEKYALVASRQR